MQAQLDITGYHVNSINIKSNPKYVESDVKSGNIKVDFDVNQSVENPLHFRINLLVEVNNGKIPLASAEYIIKLDITGYFAFNDGTSEEIVNKMIAPSGLSLLYGVARGVVSQVTGNYEHGKFILPTLNFIEIIKNKIKEHKEPAPQATRKKKVV